MHCVRIERPHGAVMRAAFLSFYCPLDLVQFDQNKNSEPLQDFMRFARD